MRRTLSKQTKKLVAMAAIMSATALQAGTACQQIMDAFWTGFEIGYGSV